MADLTITVPDPQVPRIQDAIGYQLQLGRPATTEEVRQFIVLQLTNAVRAAEIAEARDSADTGFEDPGITSV